MKTIVSVNQLSIYRAVLIWYFGQRAEDNVDPNGNLNIAQDVVTNLAGHETPDLFSRASRNRSRSVHDKNSSVEFKSRRQVWRETGFSKPVEVGH